MDSAVLSEPTLVPRLQLRSRMPDMDLYQQLQAQGYSELLARILAARLPKDLQDASLQKHQAIIHPNLSAIDRPDLLRDCTKAAERIVKAIQTGEVIGILTDYDVDGVTSHAVIFRALTQYFGVSRARIQQHIGHRLEDGYGISQPLVERILAQPTLPALIISADCGSSDEERIRQFRVAGIDLIVTDHHALPVEGPPKSAFAVVNPTRLDCQYPDATIAGVMVAWLLMSEVRNRLIQTGALQADSRKLVAELSFVALGTVADCVTTASAINRAVIQAGLKTMNRCEEACWRAAKEVLGRSKGFSVEDLGFQIGPRINARSRMADPYAALHYLLAESDQEAHRWLVYLNEDNESRKAIEKEMVASAKEEALAQVTAGRRVLVIYLEDGHPGVQGIVASRLISQFGRPVFVLCDSQQQDLLSGSGRSVAGFAMRDALQLVEEAQPGLLVKFGGHKAAAGVTLLRADVNRFAQLMEQVGRSQLVLADLMPLLWTDGCLGVEQLHLDTWQDIQKLEPFGRDFEKPLFEGDFQVVSCRGVGADPVHLSLVLERDRQTYKAIWFRARASLDEAFPVQAGDGVHCAYSLELNEFRGDKQLQLQIHFAEPNGASLP